MILSSQTARTTGIATETDAIVDLRGMWIGLVTLNVFYLIVRVYAQIFGWRAGLDSFALEFQTYWLSILWTEIPLELLWGLTLASYLWKTRTRDFSTLTPREEMRRIVVEVQWLVVYGITIYWGASFFTEQDGTWHMTVIRDTDFTPSHIIDVLHELPDLLDHRGRRVLLCEDTAAVFREGVLAGLSDRRDRPVHDHPERRTE
jgi:methane/ammonia monooxygenase subunit C